MQCSVLFTSGSSSGLVALSFERSDQSLLTNSWKRWGAKRDGDDMLIVAETWMLRKSSSRGSGQSVTLTLRIQKRPHRIRPQVNLPHFFQSENNPNRQAVRTEQLWTMLHLSTLPSSSHLFLGDVSSQNWSLFI